MPTAATEKPKAASRWIEIDPRSGVDVLGDEPLLVSGVARKFTHTEAEALVALRNEHGTPICRFVDVRGSK